MMGLATLIREFATLRQSLIALERAGEQGFILEPASCVCQGAALLQTRSHASWNTYTLPEINRYSQASNNVGQPSTWQFPLHVRMSFDAAVPNTSAAASHILALHARTTHYNTARISALPTRDLLRRHCHTAPSHGGESTVECVVIGAGVVGLAVARALALQGRETVLVEAAGAAGTETSSRHSEVIHAGIYYPVGSLKARLCVEGKMMLYDYCRTHDVPYKIITKLIVATSRSQLPELQSFRSAASRHGVSDLQLLTRGEATSLEPALGCEGALLSPSTGILDSHRYMAALQADAEAAGALVALHTRVAGGWVEEAPGGPARAGGATGAAKPEAGTGSTATAVPATTPVSALPYKVLELHSLVPGAVGGGGGDGVSGGSAVQVSLLRARWVVNAAGLGATALAARVAGVPRASIPALHLAKGNYFSLSGRCPFSRLIYPLPERGLAGLGTHLTLDMAGGPKFGPDVEWLTGPEGADPGGAPQLDYRVDPRRAAAFYPAIRRFFPGLPDNALQPAYSGVRPKLSGPGEPPADFMVQGHRQGHGVRGWINLYGIESPGLTSSLALAEYVCKLLDD